MSKIVLTGQERQALLSLKKTTDLQERTQNRLATGLKISNSIDGPQAFFQSKDLSSRASDLLERMDAIEQAISLIVATQNALDGVTDILQQMKGFVSASAVPSSVDPDQFDQMINQLNHLVDDAYYQETNLLTNNASAGEDVQTSSKTVEFSTLSTSKVVINGDYAGTSYYLSNGGDAKLIPDSTGDTVTLSGSSGTSLDAIGGSETVVNTTTSGDQGGGSQYGSQIADLAGGGYVVTWSDASAADVANGGSGDGVYFQIYDADGDKVGSEVSIPGNIANDQWYPDVAGLEGGGFVITWRDDSNGLDASGIAIRGQVFDADGTKTGSEFQLNDADGTANELGDQSQPIVTALTGGGFAVTWQGASVDDSSGISAKVFSADGTALGNQFLVNQSTTGTQGYHHITNLADGGFLVTWADPSGLDGDTWGVYARQFDSSGNAVTDQFLVNEGTAGIQYDPSAAVLSDGSYVIVWEDSVLDGSGSGVFARRYSSSGTLLTNSAYQVNTTTFGAQGFADIIGLNDGGYMIAWTDHGGEDGSGAGIFAQRFDANDTKVGGEVQLNTIISSNQIAPKLALLNDGSIAVTWDDAAGDGSGYAVMTKRFAPSLSAGALDGANVTTTDYDNDTVGVTIGGTTVGVKITKQGLGVAHAWYYQDFDTEAGRTEALSDLNAALDTVRSLSSRLGSELSLLQTRADFTEQYTDDLKEGADKLVLADVNEEGANLLALQTRQSLGMQALNFLGQAANGILGMFR